MEFLQKISVRQWAFLALGAVVVQALALFVMGRLLLCECGYITLWTGDVLGPENSQQISDWYTFSHIIHGFLFYALFRWLFPNLSWVARLAFAVALEAAWEVWENTPLVIDHYRQQALAQGYVGDTILNSFFDTLAMVGGFILAWRLPTWAIIVLTIAMEAFTIYMIRDGLALNIINFAGPLEFISTWQSGS